MRLLPFLLALLLSDCGGLLVVEPGCAGTGGADGGNACDAGER